MGNLSQNKRHSQVLQLNKKFTFLGQKSNRIGQLIYSYRLPHGATSLKRQSPSQSVSFNAPKSCGFKNTTLSNCHQQLYGNPNNDPPEAKINTKYNFFFIFSLRIDPLNEYCKNILTKNNTIFEKKKIPFLENGRFLPQIT